MRRVALAALLLAPGCGSSEIPAQHTAYGDVPKLDYAKPKSIDDAGDYVVPPRPKRRPARSGVRPELTSDRTTVPAGDVWGALARCESGGDPANKENPRYRGAFQFSYATWKSVGGSGDPADASYSEQLGRAQVLRARSGWGQWPKCSRELGLR